MKRKLVTEGITKAQYETTASAFKNPEKAKQYRKFFDLLDKEQQLMGEHYKVTLQIRNYGDVLVPFFYCEKKVILR